ncbi:MAG: hypothetical protein JKY02_00335 [Flavobacteriaceae bacterium]|nr:hypothetical protein [Flavobacteriaceae bacterium]
MCAKKAIIVFRHGDKDDDKNGVTAKKPQHLENLPSNNYYNKTLIEPGVSGKPIAIYYSALTELGYTEGTSFGVTIPQLVSDKKLAPIKHAFIVNPKPDGANGNSYITSYPLLTELVKDDSFTFGFYIKATDVTSKLNLDDYEGSILVVGTAGVLAEEGCNFTGDPKVCNDPEKCDKYGNGIDSIICHLDGEYGGNATKPHRGKDIYVYSKEDQLEKYIQDPDTQTYS